MLSKQLAAAGTRRASYPLVISNIRVPSVASVVLPVIRVIRVHFRQRTIRPTADVVKLNQLDDQSRRLDKGIVPVSGTGKSPKRVMNKIIERTVLNRKQNGVS